MLLKFLFIGIGFYLLCFFIGIISGLMFLILKSICTYLYKIIINYLYQPPSLSKNIKDKVLQDAAEFVHSKHRVGEYEYFHEYLWVSAERLSNKWEEVYGKEEYNK